MGRICIPDEEFVQRVLTMVISEGAQAFELLPLVTDAGILRNILYSGVWGRYAALQNPQPKPNITTRIKRLALRPAHAVRRRMQSARRRTKS